MLKKQCTGVSDVNLRCGHECVRLISSDYSADGPYGWPLDDEEFPKEEKAFRTIQDFAEHVVMIPSVGSMGLLCGVLELFECVLENPLADDTMARTYKFLFWNVIRWIEVAGQEIYKQTDVPGQFTGYSKDRFYGERLWKGPNGYSKARWGFWKHRFQELTRATDPNISAPEKDQAVKALQRMTQVETSHL